MCDNNNACILFIYVLNKGCGRGHVLDGVLPRIYYIMTIKLQTQHPFQDKGHLQLRIWNPHVTGQTTSGAMMLLA